MYVWTKQTEGILHATFWDLWLPVCCLLYSLSRWSHGAAAKASPACVVLLLVRRWNPGNLGRASNSCFLWNRVAFSASLGAHKVRLSSVSPGVLELSSHLSRIDCGVKNSPAVVGVTTVPVMDRMSYFYSCKNCARRWTLKGWVKVISHLEKREHCKKETV